MFPWSRGQGKAPSNSVGSGTSDSTPNSGRPDGDQTQWRLVCAKMQNVLYLVVAERPNHRRCKTEGDRLQHQAFNGMPRFDIDVVASSIFVLRGRALKRCGNADDRRRRCDPLLAACRDDELFTSLTGLDQKQLMLAGEIAVYTGNQVDDSSSSDIQLQRSVTSVTDGCFGELVAVILHRGINSSFADLRLFLANTPVLATTTDSLAS